ncbi:MAG: lysophospholipase L1-like esterase [Paenibacillaceae bacterium]|jgi:lysophospholipase L1-like esterase|nr:lysophospholipase L1-like esterase [Paenibacillaceae bacterium]
MNGKWTDKTWATLGDSITAANGYQPLVQKALGFAAVQNLGKSGCPMTAGGERDYGATTHMGQAIEGTPDCITIFAGTNDFRLDMPIGTIETRSKTTFYGAYTALAEEILTAHPASRLNLWTPLMRDKDGWNIFSVNGAGHRLADYVEAVQEVGMRYALPVLDLYGQSGINLLTLSHFTSDRLHPNEAGHLRIAGMAASFLAGL